MGINAILPKIKTQDTIVFYNSLFSSEDRLILAPMQNLSNLFFRKTFARFFPNTIDFAVSPFLSACKDAVSVKHHQFQDILPRNNEGSLPVVPQIIGRDPEAIVSICKTIESLGYSEVNLNMGCPKKDMISRQRGSGLLPYPDVVRQIVENILHNTHLRVSVKLRLGVKDPQEIYRLIPVLNDLDLKSVCIHPRTAAQQYSGKADVDAFEQVSKQLHHLIVYNGDINSVEDFRRLKTRMPHIKHWMIGRGLIGNPLLAGEIRAINYQKDFSLAPFIRELQANFSQTLRYPNERLVLNKMKEFSKYLCTAAKIDPSPFVHCNTLAEIDKLFDQTSFV